MKSHWSIVYKTANTGTFIKKLEHFLGAKLLDVKTRNDYPLDGENYSCIDCFIDHSSQEWSSLLNEMLGLARKLSLQWDISIIDTSNKFTGQLDCKLREEIGGFQIEGPSGLRLIEWVLDKSQSYTRLW